MITVLKQGTTEEQRNQLIEWFEEQGVQVHEYIGQYQTVLGLIGDTSHIDVEMLELLDIVEKVTPISEPFKSANRKFHPEDSVIDVHGAKCGGGHFAVIAGPCSVENPDQIREVAEGVKAAGATMLRGGAFKPRTSPYDFQGMKAEGIELLLEAKKATGLPIVTEIMNANHLPLFEEVDVIQVGSRNMQNLCTRTRSEERPSAYLDLSAVPVLHSLTHLPVVVDPSHATGHAHLVKPMAMAATACGADGLMIEVHNNPAKALCDGAQSLTPAQFTDVMDSVRKIREVI